MCIGDLPVSLHAHKDQKGIPWNWSKTVVSQCVGAGNRTFCKSSCAFNHGPILSRLPKRVSVTFAGLELAM